MNKNPKNHKDVVDSKVSNFKMYKVNKHWVFASALMLSMLGAGMMQTDTAAHADTVNEPQTEMVHKVAEAKEAQSASVTPAKETTTAASSAAPSSAAPAKAAQSSIQNDSAAKTKKDATASSAASSAAPTKTASSAADKSATSAAAQPEQKNDASASKNEQKTAKADSTASSSAAKPAADTKTQANNSSAAKPADQSSASNSDASVKKEGVSTDEIGTSGLDTNDQNDINNDAAAKAKADVDAKDANKDVDKAKKADKNKTAKDRDPRAGTSVLEDGNLEIDGDAIDGLIDGGDGLYAGELEFIYNGKAFDDYDMSNFVLRIPEQLRELFRKISLTGNWSKYFSGHGKFYGSAIRKGWTYENDNFSFDGTNLIVKNPPAHTVDGLKNTDITLNFKIGEAVTDFKEDIPDASDNYVFKSAVVNSSSIIDWKEINGFAGTASLITNHLMPHQDKLNPPTVNQPIYDSSTEVTGKAEPNADITITLPNGNTVSGKADANGNFKISIPTQTAGSQIEVTQSIDGSDPSDPTIVTIAPTPEVIDKPTINAPHAGSRIVTGTGIPGDVIQVYTPGVNGSSDVMIGYTSVGADGKWTAKISDEFNLIEGQQIYAIQSKGDAKSDKAYTTVLPEVAVDAPVINPIMEGDTVITGTGEPGDTIKVYFDGSDAQIGKSVTVDENGNWTVDCSDYNLQAGRKIYAIQSKDGEDSEPTYATVKAREVVESPTINDVTEGDTVITGTGEPGDTIKVYFDGSDAQIGKSVTVDENGNWTVDCSDYNLKAGRKIYAIQSKDGEDSEPAYATVKAREVVKAPTINDVTEGDTVITGTGEPGDTIKVYFDGSDTQIGKSVTVDENGNWTVDCSDYNLQAGRKIYAIQSKDGKDSEPTYATVKAREVVGAPIINDVTEDNTVITGTGKPGATVNVTVGGQPLPPVTVDDQGNWTVDVSGVTLNEGDEVSATQSKDGVTSDATTTTVQPKKSDVPVPGMDPIKPGAKVIKGTGIPGNTVTIVKVNADGSTTPIGTVPVDDFGNWTVDVPDDVVLAVGDTVRAVQTTPDSESSDPTDVIVTE